MCSHSLLQKHQNHNQLLDNHQQEDTAPHQKRHPTSKDKGEATVRWQEGCNHSKIKSHNCCVGDSQTGEHLYHRSPPTGVKVLSPTSGFATWGFDNGRRNSQRIRLRSLVGIDCRTSTGLGETETPLQEGTHKVVCSSGPRDRSSDPKGD